MKNYFTNIYGNMDIKERLSNAIDKEKLHHAYLFVGPYGYGSLNFALKLASILLCENVTDNDICCKCSGCVTFKKGTNRDFIYIHPLSSKKEFVTKKDDYQKLYASFGYNNSIQYGRFIKLDQIKTIIDFSQYNSYSGKPKVVIIDRSDMMNKEAMNSLLKILEEPPPNFFFIMTSINTESLLPTIVSRSQIIRFEGLTVKELRSYAKDRLDKQLTDDDLEKSLGSISRLTILLGKGEDPILQAEDILIGIFYSNIFTETLEKIDYFLAFIKEKKLAEGDLDAVFQGSHLRILERNRKLPLKQQSMISNLYDHLIYLYKRNINPKLLLTNYYLKYRDIFIHNNMT